jgi:hypothetical protein
VSATPQRPPAPRWAPTILVACLCLALEGIVDALMRHEAGLSGDERFYQRMAVHPSGPHNFPYAYRVAVPWLVHVLPFSTVVSFTALALLAGAAAGGAMYALLRHFDVPAGVAIGLAVGFALAPNLIVVLVRHGRSVDDAIALVITLGTLFIVRRRRLALAVTLVIGAGVHESCLFLIPFAYAVWAERPLDRAALRDTALVAMAPLAVYVVLRSSIAAAGSQFIPGYSGPFLQARWNIIRQGLSGSDLGQQLRRLALAYGPLWLVAPVALRDSSFARRGLVLVILCLASMSYAFGWGRIIFFAAPVFYVAAGQAVANRRRLALVTVAAVLAFDVAYAVYLQVHGVQYGINATIGPSTRVPVY